MRKVWNSRSFLMAFILLAVSPLAGAAEAKLSGDAVAMVNKVTILKSDLDWVVKLAVGQGQKDTPELRELAKQDLIERQLLAQTTTKVGLDKTPEAKAQLEQIRTGFLVDLALKDYFIKHPISDDDLKSEYERQLGLLGNVKEMQQYKISHVLLPTEDKAKEVLAKIKGGESFVKVAEKNTTDKTPNVTSDWVLLSQVGPEVSGVLAKLDKGGLSDAPIKLATGWLVIKVEDKRQFVPPSFDDSKLNVRTALIRKIQAEYIKKLRDSAQIVQ